MKLLAYQTECRNAGPAVIDGVQVKGMSRNCIYKFME